MNNRALTLSVVMAVFAVFFVQSYVESIEESTKKKYGTEILVVAAKKDIPEMANIDETMVELKRIPKRFLEPSAVFFDTREKSKDVISDMRNTVVGSVAVVPVKSGEQITRNKLTEPSIRTGLSPQVSPGKRAVSVPVSEVTGVGKLVKPGDRVDVIAVVQAGGGGNAGKISKTILQDAMVLAVGRNVTNNIARFVEKDPYTKKTKVRPLSQFDGFSSVTLEVEPFQVQVVSMVLAGGNNRLFLALRNNDDTNRLGLRGLTLDDVLGSDKGRIRRPANRGNRNAPVQRLRRRN